MEIKVGIVNISREIVVESSSTAAEVEKAFAQALADGGLFSLTDERGRKVLIPVGCVGYLDIGQEGARHVGFGVV